ncbi:caspase family protein [Azospirillum sp. TSO22-1]|uniref:caspase family protein n=1 Tax=Azospirillum sp. TSO22-1 TaxID=716789 RepID=UPI000D61FD03|nr:caspase family protein [Azospirillum sp. TSO22-1]PWC54959.1 peptidase C14 [Azospirillum sp. TSO22-1]
MGVFGRILAALAALACLAAGPALAEGKRVALVLGIGAYRNAAPLANPTNDARAIADALNAAGFELIGGGPQVDLDRAGIEKAIRAFGTKLVGADVGLFFYAGHGIQVQGSNYLVPVTANVAREADVRYELVDVNLVIEEMTLADSRLNIVILDACRNNPFGGRGLRSAGSGLAQMQAPAGTIIAYATQPGAVAADGAGSNSPYTEVLSKAVLTPGGTVFDVFNDVGVAVKRNTAGVQQPWVSSSPIEGRFYFLGPTTITPPPAAADKEVVFWDSVKGSSNPRMFEAYLKQFPQGTFAALAETRLAELSAAPAPASAPRAEAPVPAPVQIAVAAPPAPPAPMVRLFDAAAIPYVSPKARETLGRFASLPSPKALAISPKGNYAYVSNTTQTRTAEDVRRSALQHCQLNAGSPCTLYAVDDAVLLDSPVAFAPMPVEIPGSGLFDPAKVPFVSDRTREVGMVKYRQNPGHKALALTPTGRWAAVWARKSIDDAREAVLERCEELSGKAECTIYAVNDAVVFDEER